MNTKPLVPEAAANKEKAVSFLQLAATGRVRDAYQSYTGPGFRHHNPYFRGDAESLMIGMEESAAENPQTSIEIKHVLEEGDFVMVHSHVRHKPEDPGFAVVHICRFKDGLIAEFWDVGQVIPEDSPNENGVF